MVSIDFKQISIREASPVAQRTLIAKPAHRGPRLTVTVSLKQSPYQALLGQQDKKAVLSCVR